MPNELERIRVTGYKSIRELDFELRPLNVLIGANGSGKSNFISLFQLLNEILEGQLENYTKTRRIDSFLYYGRKITERINIQLTFKTDANQPNGYKISLIPSDMNTLVLGYEVIQFSNYDLPIMSLESQRTHFTSNSIALPAIEAMTSWKIYHFHDTSREAGMKQMQSLHDNERLRPDASNLAPFLYLLQEKHPHTYKLIVNTIRRVAPFFKDFVLRPSPLNEENIRLEWNDVNSDLLFDAHSLSDGTLRFICLVTLLLQPDAYLPSVILIDEPELGLHPFAINILAGLLQSASTKTQVIVSTQSVPLINQFAPEDIVVVDRKDRQSTFERLEADALKIWMTEYSEYGVGDLWEKNIIGGRPQAERK